MAISLPCDTERRRGFKWHASCPGAVHPDNRTDLPLVACECPHHRLGGTDDKPPPSPPGGT